ncbi:MAG: helix-turn-helix domain-containing protein [Leucobacter sp.]|nr:helix-turn-helix domain-containing protein [Leucobacter sp.]
MSFDLRTVTRVVGGSYVDNGIPDHTSCEGLARVGEYVVVASAEFATLVTGSVTELQARFARGTEAAKVTARAVFVTEEDSPRLRKTLAAHGMSAVLGATIVEDALHLRLAALLADDRAASDRLVASGTRVLTQVARRGGATAVMAELAHRIDGWAVLLDAHGQLIASAGAGRLHLDDAKAVALGKPVRVRHPGLQTHQVGSDLDFTGYLVVASRSSATGRIRDLASQAAALFDLVLRTRNPSLTEHLGREALLDILEAGGSGATDLLRRWGVREVELTAFVLGTRTRTVDLERLMERWCDELGVEHLFVEDPGRVRGFVPEHRTAELADRVERFDSAGSSPLHLGLGAPASIDALGRSSLQARQAFDVALDAGQGTQRYSALPTVDFVLDAISPEQRVQLGGVLDDLRDADGAHGELLATLFVFLSEHGAHRASATRLGIHRQTLVSRMHRIEELSGLSMARPDDRAAAWLALRSLGFETQV